ncbi:metallo-beta-lactamase domain protein [Clostridiales bacterium oral taxon 876 str. F0540]|nr:metallo-beta-lactamase domain protein [Clostridiales bacterium oral taxon 876 str. F0540]
MLNFRKPLKLLSIILILALFFTGCQTSDSNEAFNSKNKGKLVVHYIDVGQADSILVQVNNRNLLIDAGNNDDKDKIISYLQKQGVKRLDYVVATHPHEDHIGGMSAVVRKFPIGDFYAPKVTNTTKTFENMITSLNGKKIKAAKAGVDLNLGENTKCEILAPNSDKYEDLNNYSAVIKITYGENKFLFMGDAEKLSENEILSKNFDISSDVIKIGHHGSSSSSGKAFLDKVSPKIAVISCGRNNDYGHPHKETLSELKTRKITTYRTDIDGTIVLIADGKKISKQ